MLPLVKRCSRESLVWRGIRHTWDKVVAGCSWQVGDGGTIRFWKDSWIVSGHILLNLALHEVPQNEQELPLAHFYDEGRWWNTHLFEHLLPQSTVQEIISFHDVRANNGRDEVVWSGTTSGAFSTKSAFEMITNTQAHRNTEDFWKKIW